jgi:hypothetical protein
MTTQVERSENAQIENPDGKKAIAKSMVETLVVLAGIYEVRLPLIRDALDKTIQDIQDKEDQEYMDSQFPHGWAGTLEHLYKREKEDDEAAKKRYHDATGGR